MPSSSTGSFVRRNSPEEYPAQPGDLVRVKIKHFGTAVGVVEEFTTIETLVDDWDNIDGMRIALVNGAPQSGVNVPAHRVFPITPEEIAQRTTR